MVKSCLHDLSFMSKKCSRLRWTMKLTSLGNEACFVCQRSLLHFFMVFNEKPHTFSLLFRRDGAVYLYTLWINTIERRCCIRFACRISEHR